MGIRLLILDIDGTIAGQSNAVSPGVCAALEAVMARGILVAIATGRMYCSAQRFRDQIRSREPIIAYNGAWIQHPETGDRLLHRPVPPERLAELLDLADHPDWVDKIDVHVYHDDRLYVREITLQTESYMARSGLPAHPVGDLRQLLDRPLTKLLMLCADTEAIATLLTQCQTAYPPDHLYITQSSPTFLEFTHPQASKGHAVTHLAQDHYGFDLQEVMAIGDNYNDLDMLQAVGLGIAMGDAPEAVKAAADWVAPSVEADGVAVAVQKFLLSPLQRERVG